MMQFMRKNVKAIMLVIVILFVVSCFTMYTGGRGGSSGANEDYTVAVVNGEDIMRSRIEREMYQWLHANNMGSAISDDELLWVRSAMLDQIAIDSEMKREISARGISVTKEELDAEIKAIENEYPTREIFMQELQRLGMTDRALRELIENQMKVAKVMEQVLAAASADETEKTTFYDTFKSFRYQQPEAFLVDMAHFSTIEKAKDARKQIDSGKKWDDVMKSMSPDILFSTPQGEPVPIPLADLQDRLAPLADLQMNKTSDPVEVMSNDFMIIIKREKQDARVLDYDEVSDDVEMMLLGQKRQTLQSEFMRELRSRASVQILDDSIFMRAPEPIDTVSADETLQQIFEVSGDAVSADSRSSDISADAVK